MGTYFTVLEMRLLRARKLTQRLGLPPLARGTHNSGRRLRWKAQPTSPPLDWVAHVVCAERPKADVALGFVGVFDAEDSRVDVEVHAPVLDGRPANEELHVVELVVNDSALEVTVLEGVAIDVVQAHVEDDGPVGAQGGTIHDLRSVDLGEARVFETQLATTWPET